ncbi:MFS transporter [Allokutzneria oryzae]|uniref:MFS transporter n=1 Tax=Allokutzneria oryzae TaxID=1378989 RepID=A0ABV5ZTV1_9PSEU
MSAARRNRIALLVALGADNFGSGLFLPLALVYVTQVVGLPLGTAGTVVALGTAFGLLVPPVAGRFVDRVGPRPVVITSQLLQAAGAFAYLVADGVVLVVLAALLLAAGQQLFYSSLFALIADVAGSESKDRAFAVVGMVRAGSFGAGALAAGGLLTVAGPFGFQVAVAADAVSFLGCAVLLAAWVRVEHVPRHQDSPALARLLTDRPYLALIGITGLVALSTDFFLVGVPVYAIDQLSGPLWLPGAALALHTAVTSVGGTAALRVTNRFSRTTAMAIGAGLVALWCVVSLVAVLLPLEWRPGAVLASTSVLSVGGLFFAARGNAIAVEIAPQEVRGRYLAAFQYAYTVPGFVTPAVVGLFSVSVWLPWMIVAVCSAVAVVALPRLARRLPAHALTAG